MKTRDEDGHKSRHSEDEGRFWERVDRSGDCWLWTAGCFQRGYGAFKYGGHNPGYAHRFSYELHHGKIPPGMVVMHTCDNRKCVNPDHLKVGTQRQNVHDAVRKGRWMSEARKEHLRKAKHGLRHRYKQAWGNKENACPS